MTAVSPETKLTSRDLATAIRTRYERPEWHVEEEVTLAGRRLDLVAFNLWTSRANRIVGFELKVSRGDWVRELDQFQKSEDWCAVVDAFYVVTPPKLVRDGELPDGWGLLELTGSRMMTRRHATVREGATTLPREIAARFVGRLAQRDAQEDRSAYWRASDELRKEARESAEAKLGPEVDELRKENAELKRERSELYRTLGVEPRDWHAHEAAMRAAGIFADAQRGSVAIKQRLETNAAQFESLARQMREASGAVSRLELTTRETGGVTP